MRVPLIAILPLCLLAQDDPTEGERKAYDRIYANEPGTFSSEPNGFLVRTMSGRKPGLALDVAMGQGRNALWLAARGWTVTGFDISLVAIKQARRQAAQRGLKIETLVAPFEQFDWGRDKWDLIVFSYFFPQSALPKVWDSLKPGGLILIEGFHADTARVRPIGGGHTDKLMFQTLANYRILIYEDVEGRQEWGRQYGVTNRLVRVLAQRPAPPISGCVWQGRGYASGESMCWGRMSSWKCGADGWEHTGKCSL